MGHPRRLRMRWGLGRAHSDQARRREVPLSGRQIEPASTAAQFPCDGILVFLETFLTAELLEPVGVPDQAELPFAPVTSFCHDASVSIFSIRFNSMFCVG